jgi:hypothetical protein
LSNGREKVGLINWISMKPVTTPRMQVTEDSADFSVFCGLIEIVAESKQIEKSSNQLRGPDTNKLWRRTGARSLAIHKM